MLFAQKFELEMVNNKQQLFNVGLLVAATILLAKVIVKWAHKTCSRSNKRLPPVVKGWFPVIGGLLRFLNNPGKMLTEEYKKFGSVFTLNALNKDITFLLEPQVSGHFFRAAEEELSQREVYRFTVPIFGPGVIFDADYSKRQEQFGFFQVAFQINRLRSYVTDMQEEVQNYFSKWGEKGEVDLKEAMDEIIILIASRCFLGQEVRQNLSDDINPLMTGINSASVPLTTIFPYLPIPSHTRRDNSRVKLDNLLSNIISSRKSSKNIKNDMLQCLIDSKYKDGRPTTVEEVVGMLITILYGGQLTGAATSIWTGIYLLHYKKYWFSAIEEQKKLIKKHGKVLNYDILSEMQVLYRCIKEILRLHPPNSFLLRQSHRDFSVTTREGKKYDVPKGNIIATSPFFSNRLSYIYRNPDEYDPERFSPERDEDKLAGPFSFISFGGGKHSCLGQPFAYMMIKSIWCYLLRNFEMELISPFPETDRNNIVWSAKGKVMVRYKRTMLATD